MVQIRGGGGTEGWRDGGMEGRNTGRGDAKFWSHTLGGEHATPTDKSEMNLE